MDQFAAGGKLDAAVIDLLASILPFNLSESDDRFLVNYIRWRMDYPIVK